METREIQPDARPDRQRPFTARFRLERWALIVSMTAILCGSIGWGLPDAARVDLLLAGEPLTERQQRLLTTLRESHYAGASIARDAGSDLSEVERIEALRAFLIGSAAVDERKPYSALSRMDPARLDLDPGIYLYGGSFLYPIGAAIVAADAVGWLTIHRRFHRYVERPEDAARLYMLGRAVSIGAYLGVLILLGSIGDRLGGRLGGRMTGSFAMLAWAFSTLPLNQAVVTKPHVYAAFWTLLSVHFALRSRHGRLPDVLGAGLAGGIAAGASLPAALGVLFLPVLIGPQGSRRARARSAALLWAVAAGCFLATNPYLPFVWRSFVEEVVSIGSSEGWGYAQVVLGKLPRYVGDVVFRAYAVPLSVVGLVAAVSALFGGSARLRRLAVFFLVQLLAVGLTLANLRISLFLGPILCLFAGTGMAWLWSWTAQRSRAQWSRVAAILLLGLLCLPGALFAALFARDTLRPPDRPPAVERWVERISVAEAPSYGIYPPLHPVKTPPFPFLDARVVRLDRLTAAAEAPEWVLVGNHEDDLGKWERHPLRNRYELALVIGAMPFGEWAQRWRMENQAYKLARVYRERATQSARGNFRRPPPSRSPPRAPTHGEPTLRPSRSPSASPSAAVARPPAAGQPGRPVALAP